MRIKPTKYAMLLPLIAIMVCLYSYGHYTGSFETRTVPTVTVTTTQPNIYDLWRLTNAERAKNGLEPLVLNEKLNKLAESKCSDLVTRDYYAHTTPDNKPFTDLFNMLNVSYRSAGENIAAGDYATAQSVHTAWMASEEHKKNILDIQFTDIGMAVCHSNDHAIFGYGNLVVEDFTQR